MDINCSQLVKYLEDKKYALSREFNGKAGKINVIGVRKKDSRVNRFDDTIAIAWQDKTKWNVKTYAATTRPGLYWLNNLLNPKGSAILVPGQYVNSFRLGEFKGAKALKQFRDLTVYRDKNKDSKFDIDPSTVEQGQFGIHIHGTKGSPEFVGRWSGGCQVIQKEAEYKNFLAHIEESAKIYGELFTYTLIVI